MVLLTQYFLWSAYFVIDGVFIYAIVLLQTIKERVLTVFTGSN